jgi:hypothetical protein
VFQDTTHSHCHHLTFVDEHQHVHQSLSNEETTAFSPYFPLVHIEDLRSEQQC